MKVEFVLHDNGTIPLVFIDHQQLAVESLTYAFHTKTDKVYEGANICIIDGYLNGETLPRRFLFDILKGEAKEESYINDTERVFEVCVDPGVSAETEVWQKTAFKDLKDGNLVRILDAGQYYKDLNGNALWVVIDTKGVMQGTINVEPFAGGVEHGIEQ